VKCFRGTDLVTELETAMRREMDERKQKEAKEAADQDRYYRETKEDYALRTPTLLAAVARAEGPYRALLNSVEWSRTLEAVSIGKDKPLTALDVPGPILHPRQFLSFGATVILEFRIHLMAPRFTVLELRGTLEPIATWWREGLSIPQEPGSRRISLNYLSRACPTVLNLCELLEKGRLLRTIQAVYLRRVAGSPLRRFARAVSSRVSR
jgi:hypothetical protein